MARDEKAKPKYESPVILPLGEMARSNGVSAACPSGSSPQASCHTGTYPSHGSDCASGTGASSCKTGSIAAAACPQGNTAHA